MPKMLKDLEYSAGILPDIVYLTARPTRGLPDISLNIALESNTLEPVEVRFWPDICPPRHFEKRDANGQKVNPI